MANCEKCGYEYEEPITGLHRCFRRCEKYISTLDEEEIQHCPFYTEKTGIGSWDSVEDTYWDFCINESRKYMVGSGYMTQEDFDESINDLIKMYSAQDMVIAVFSGLPIKEQYRGHLK